MNLEENDVFSLMKEYIPERYWDYLMYMGRRDGINLYKHYTTRMYINVDKDGNFYKYNGIGYDKISEEEAIDRMLS